MSATKLLPRHHDEFRSKDYWDTFFEQRTDAFEWYGEYEDLRKLVHHTLRRSDRILVVGCGNSNFSAELYDDGFEEIESVDFSEGVIAEMERAHAAARPRMLWRVMDVTDMSEYEDASFDAVVDKGTLDALMSEDTPEVRANGEAMLKEVSRILKPSGRYMCVTLWQDFIGSSFLSSSLAPTAVESGGADKVDGDHVGWKLDLHSAAASSKPSPYLPMCAIATHSSVGGRKRGVAHKDGGGSNEGGGVEDDAGTDKEAAIRVAVWFDGTGRPLPDGVEASTVRSEKEVLTRVRDAHQMHRRRYDLRDICPGRFEQEDLWGGDGELGSPRFTFFIVDVAVGARSDVLPCAVVLIPRGRDRDFTFSSQEGLGQVAESANARRLIAVRLNRGHTFSDGVDGVKTEISPMVSDFAPQVSSSADTDGPGIPIMAVGDGLGVEGRVVAEGTLECSGRFVVEEEEEEEEDDDSRPPGVYRRLIFLKNEGVVQTEVRMLGEGENDGTSCLAKNSKPSLKGGGSKKGKGKGKGKSKGVKGKKGASAASAAAAVQDGVNEGGLCRMDSSHLCFEYHRCMVAGAALADLRMKTGQESGGDVRAPTALVIGLGGGALPMVLRRMYPNLKVAAVELDPEMAGIAKEHFGLKESQHLKVIVEDGLTFVNRAAAAAAGATDATESPLSTGVAPSAPGDTTTSTTNGLAPESEMPPAPPREQNNAEAVAWGGVFGPPYSAIFLDVDSKDTSVGMSCPPSAFLETPFLNNLKSLLHGGVGNATGGRGDVRGAGVLTINVAARSKELFGGAIDSVCATFQGGEVHKLRAGEDDVNSVVLALPRPRGRARSGPLLTVAEQALASSTVSRKAVASILEVCERAESVQAGQLGKASGRSAKKSS